jgi:hypothetical protein
MHSMQIGIGGTLVRGTGSELELTAGEYLLAFQARHLRGARLQPFLLLFYYCITVRSTKEQ